MDLFPQHRTILSLCDYTGNWSRPYVEKGYDVVRVDIKHGDDVRLWRKMDRKIHGVLAAPVCTKFAVSGARWWKADEANGNPELLKCLDIMNACMRIIKVEDPEFWCLENPVGRASDWIGDYVMTFNPNEYAGWLEDEEERANEAYTKRTCLWGDFNIPQERPVEPVLGSKMWSQYGGKSEKTKAARSATPLGFSYAFSDANP